MNGTLRYRIGMAWRCWRTIPEVTLWDALGMLRYKPVPTQVWGATVDEVEDAIRRLSVSERDRLRAFLEGLDDDAWDRQMEADGREGKFDKWVAETLADAEAGRLTEL